MFVRMAVILSFTNGRKYGMPRPSAGFFGANVVASLSRDSIVEHPHTNPKTVAKASVTAERVLAIIDY